MKRFIKPFLNRKGVDDTTGDLTRMTGKMVGVVVACAIVLSFLALLFGFVTDFIKNDASRRKQDDTSISIHYYNQNYNKGEI